MRVERLLMIAATSAVLACDRDANPPSAPEASAPDLATAFITDHPPQAKGLSGAIVKPILTVGDPLPGQESNPDEEQRVWAPLPDGLGVFQNSDNDRLVVFANHEINSSGVDDRFKYARVSRLALNPQTLAVEHARYVIDGKTPGLLFQRLCSATWVGPDESFGGLFLTGEEATEGDSDKPGSGSGDGIQLAVNGSSLYKLPWLGMYAHENQIAVPGFGTRVVMIGTDDTSPADDGALQSELYMYVAGSNGSVLSGGGKLYVFASSEAENVGELDEGDKVTGEFVEIPDPASYSATELQKKVDELGAFKFVRLEDLDYARGNVAGDPTIYFVDTGNEALCGTEPCDLAGSIYRMRLDPDDPTSNARLALLHRSKGADQEWASPDNIALSANSLMVQEDPAYDGFSRAPRIYNFKLRANGDLGAGSPVVELLNEDCDDSAGTCWESSGIVNVSEWLGSGTWLFDTQAHTLPFSYESDGKTVDISEEGGQLLYLKVSGS